MAHSLDYHLEHWKLPMGLLLRNPAIHQYQLDVVTIGSSTGNGTFIQTGGTNTAAYINIGNNGKYGLSSGTLNIKGGLENHGVWDLSNNSAEFNVSSSIITFSGSILGSGNASLNLDAHSLLIVPSGFDPLVYFKTYTNNGLLASDRVYT